MDDSEDCLLEIFEFVTIPSFVALISCNNSEPICFIKIVEKNVSGENWETDLDVKYSQENAF